MRVKILALIAFPLLAVSSCKDKKENKEEAKVSFVLNDQMYRTTKFAQVEEKLLTNQLDLFGKITADNNKLIEIYPVVGGNVQTVYVELGDFVKKDELLATIRSTEVASFEKDLNDAKNDVLMATKKLKVAQELYEGRLNTETDVLGAKSELEKAHSQLKRVEETYKIYSMKAGAIYEVRSPISGFIIQKAINQDMMLRNDHTNNIFDIAQIDEVWALANVSESDINQVKLGGKVDVVTLSYPDKVFTGTVDKIFNVIDTETKSMKVRIKLKNPDYLLKPEMKANIKISYNETNQMLSVPSNAVVFDRNSNFVLVYKDRSHIEVRKVEVFRQVGETVYVKHGLKLGETVIVQNQLLIYDALNE
jgi:membrane fusion protein, heavy metal efflux system